MCTVIGEFMSELTYEELRRIQSREREPGISKIQDDFYMQLPSLISKYRTAKDSGEHREYENILKILKYIHSRRVDKILTASINSIRGVETPSGLLKEELEVYRKFAEIIKSENERFEKGLCSNFSNYNTVSSESEIVAAPESKEKEQVGKGSATSCFSVKIVKDIDEFVGLDGKVYGPYKTGIEAVLPVKEAETLLKMKMVEKA